MTETIYWPLTIFSEISSNDTENGEPDYEFHGPFDSGDLREILRAISQIIHRCHRISVNDVNGVEVLRIWQPRVTQYAWFHDELLRAMQDQWPSAMFEALMQQFHVVDVLPSA